MAGTRTAARAGHRKSRKGLAGRATVAKSPSCMALSSAGLTRGLRRRRRAATAKSSPEAKRALAKSKDKFQDDASTTASCMESTSPASSPECPPAKSAVAEWVAQPPPGLTEPEAQPQLQSQPQLQQPQQATRPPSIKDAVEKAVSSTANATPVSDQEVATGFAAALSQMVALTASKQPLTCFHAVRAPSISVKEYMARIFRFFGCSGSCYVLGLVYIDRLIQSQPHIAVTTLSVHRLLYVSMMIAAKFHDDIFYSNSYYAKIGGLSLKEVNSLEAKFLKYLDFRLQVNAVEFVKYRNLCLAILKGPQQAAGESVRP